MKKLAAAILLAALTISSTNFNGNARFSNIAIEASAAATLNKPVLKGEKRTSTTAVINISKVKGADGYTVYRSLQKGSGFVNAGTAKNSGSYTDSGLKAARRYYYKVRAYEIIDGSKVYSSYSNVYTMNTALAKTNGLESTVDSKGTVTLQWNSVSSVTKYKVYRAMKSSRTFEYIGMANSTHYTDNTAVNGRSYSYKVRAYNKIGGVKYNGIYSNISVPKKDNNNSLSDNSSFEAQVLSLVNKERQKEGLHALTMTNNLGKAAEHRAKETVKSFSHTRPDGTSFSTVLQEFSVPYRASGENIAWGQRTPEEVMNAWMNSSGHRANIMGSQFGKIGIGCYNNNGTLYWVQLFTN